MKIKFIGKNILLEQNTSSKDNVESEINKLRSIVANGIMFVDDLHRMFIILKTPNGAQTLYKSSGDSETGHKDMWLPVYGMSLNHPDDFGYPYYMKYGPIEKEAPPGSIIDSLGKFLFELEKKILSSPKIRNFRDAWKKMGGHVKYFSVNIDIDSPETMWENMSAFNRWIKNSGAPLKSPLHKKVPSLPGITLTLEQVRAANFEVTNEVWK